jgi:YesN/AraC family two-component response regulator
MKIDWARILLETGTLNVTEVARRVGYADAFYFSRVFKKHAGTSPKNWPKKREPGKDMATRGV